MSIKNEEQIKVLHVDSKPDVTDVTAAFLEHEDGRFSVETATTAEEGRKRINNHPPDCVVSGYNMPGMDGVEFLQAVRADRPALPFILYTGTGSEAVASDAIAAGVTDYIQKESGAEQHEHLANRIENVVMARQSQQTAQQRTEPSDGQRRPTAVHTHTITTADGHVQSVLPELQDISEHKRRMTDREKYQTIIDALTDPMYILDEEGKFTYINDEFVALVGYTRERILGSSPTLIKGETAATNAEHQLGQLLSDTGPETVTFEVTIEPCEGDPIICEDRMGVLPYDGDQFNGSVGTLRDITARKQREQELAETNEQLDQFVSTVSHDLRNPLGVARGYLTKAERTGDQADIDTVYEALDRMDTMIEELLTVARAETIIEEKEPIRLADLAVQAWETAQTENASLVVAIDETTTIDGDKELLQSILENLFRNALDHNDPPVTVQVGMLEVDTDTDTGGFYVADDGTGIPEAEREEIFDHGYTNSEDGTGFGLAIVQKFVRAHGWNISVTDSTEGGARFEIQE